MNEPALHEGQDADERLASMGLTRSLLATVLLQADAEAAQVTALDPPTAEGMARYAATVRFLRMALVPRGWQHDNSGNFCRTVAPNGLFSIVTSSGDADTGEATGNPSTKYVKGEATTKAVSRNQFALDLGPEFELQSSSTMPDAPTWFLLQRVEQDAIHAELSLPRSSSAGKITVWQERIVLDVVDRSAGTGLDRLAYEGEDLAYDVDVSLRQM